MSIFGTGSFKFTGTGSPDSTERTLTYGVLTPEYQQPDLIEKTNPLTGLKYYNLRGSYATFNIKYHLHKEAAPSTFLSTIYSYVGKDVTNVKPRGTTIMDKTGGTPVQFTVVFVAPYPLAENAEQDILLITLKAKEYVDLGASLA